MRIIRSSLIAASLLASPLIATAENTTTVQAPKELALDAVIAKHLTALGGEKLLRSGTTFTFTVTGEKMGKKFTKTVTQAKGNKMRVDVVSDEGNFSKGFDGKAGWMKKGTEKAVAFTADENKSMASHATFEEPLLDYAKKGTKVKLAGKADLKGTLAYDLEVTLASGDVEHHFLDANTFLLVKKTWTSKDKDGKLVPMSVGFGDYKNVQGRMVNHSVAWDDSGKTSTSVVSKVAFDGKVDAKIFTMPK
jgi:hypothetical protein